MIFCFINSFTTVDFTTDKLSVVSLGAWKTKAQNDIGLHYGPGEVFAKFKLQDSHS